MTDVNPLWFVLAISVIAGLIATGKWIGGVDEHKAVANSFMKEIRNDLKEILQRLGQVTSPSMKGTSPLRLTELGENISRVLEISAWADEKADSLKDAVVGKGAYDIQQYCFDYVMKEFKPDAELDAQIKSCAFDNGIDTRGVLDVFALELRDRLLGEQELPAAPGQETR